MKFDLLLDKITLLLTERRRVSYAALRQYFELSDDLLDAVRSELIDARRVARDEDGTVLVLVEDDSHANDPEQAERRQLTVMFVDIVGSTDLASRLDPEDLREVVRDYQLTAAGAIERYSGYIAQYLGDGLLVYFGYPSAHEDDARRAVHSAQDILRAIDELNRRLERDVGVRIAVRIGIHTGLVVVGEVGAGERQESLALGKAPNVAARLEAHAEPNSIVISARTHALLGDLFTVESLGELELRGIPGVTEAFRVLASSGVASRFDTAVTHKLLPLAGRRRELAELVRHWERARRGDGSAVLMWGEAGIGKSRLVQALKVHVASADCRWIVLRASAYHTNTPLYPIIAFWQQTVGISDTASPAANLATLEASLAPFLLDHERAIAAFAGLLRIPVSDASADVAVELPELLEILTTIIFEVASERPTLLVVEDLHWMDPSTLELIRQLVARRQGHTLMMVMTSRPEFDLARLGIDDLEQLQLGHLPREDVEQMISSVAGGRTLERSVRGEIIRRTNGVPAFVEELTRMLIESDWLHDDHGHLVPSGPMPQSIPATLNDSLMARLDRLGEAKAVAQQAAVLGRAFPESLLQAVVDMPEKRVRAALEQLVEANVLRRRERRGENTYVFRHVLLQEAAYESVLKTVRQQTHLRVGEVLETSFQRLVEQQPERVAQHFTLGGAIERALGYWQWAGESAVERGAHTEALAHLRKGTALLHELPDSPLRAQRELALLTIMGPALVLTDGWAAPGLGEIYGRAMELIAATGSSENIDFQVLGGLCAYHLQRGELATVNALADRLLRQGQRQHDNSAIVVAHVCLGVATFFRGDLTLARSHCEKVLERYDPNLKAPVSFLYGQDPATITDNILGFGFWMSGETRRARHVHRLAIEKAAHLSSQFSLCLARCWYARMLYESGQHKAAHAEAVIALDIAEQKGYVFVGAMALMTTGGSTSAMGKVDTGLEQVREGIRIWRNGDNALSLSYYFSLLARAEYRAGHLDAALAALNDGFESVDTHGEYFWKSELHRLNGQWLAQSEPERACWHLERSVESANAVDAPVLKLRARVALATMLKNTGAGAGELEAALNSLRGVLESQPAECDDAALTPARALLGLPALAPADGAGGAAPVRRT